MDFRTGRPNLRLLVDSRPARLSFATLTHDLARREEKRGEKSDSREAPATAGLPDNRRFCST